jgi:hypothetical protein
MLLFIIIYIIILSSFKGIRRITIFKYKACHETGSLGLESKVEWFYSENTKLRREALNARAMVF